MHCGGQKKKQLTITFIKSVLTLFCKGSCSYSMRTFSFHKTSRLSSHSPFCKKSDFVAPCVENIFQWVIFLLNWLLFHQYAIMSCSSIFFFQLLPFLIGSPFHNYTAYVFIFLGLVQPCYRSTVTKYKRTTVCTENPTTILGKVLIDWLQYLQDFWGPFKK